MHRYYVGVGFKGALSIADAIEDGVVDPNAPKTCYVTDSFKTAAMYARNHDFPVVACFELDELPPWFNSRFSIREGREGVLPVRQWSMSKEEFAGSFGCYVEDLVFHNASEDNITRTNLEITDLREA